VCNGIDDDCNRVVDDHPTECSVENGAPARLWRLVATIERDEKRVQLARIELSIGHPA
jgi:hypothetical protein